jgi:Spy/CpxP family protein refolding chaperone
MWKIASMAMALVVSLVLVDNLSAQQRGQGPGRRGGFSPFDRIERVKDLKLTDDQKAKLEVLKKEYTPKLKELAGIRDKVLTADQKKAAEEARKAVRESGKRGPEARDSIQAAMKLTDAQKTKLADGQKAMQKLNKEISEKINKVLTPEQLEVLKKARPPRGNHGGGERGRRPAQTN